MSLWKRLKERFSSNESDSSGGGDKPFTMVVRGPKQQEQTGRQRFLENVDESSHAFPDTEEVLELLMKAHEGRRLMIPYFQRPLSDYTTDVLFGGKTPTNQFRKYLENYIDLIQTQIRNTPPDHFPHMKTQTLYIYIGSDSIFDEDGKSPAYKTMMDSTWKKMLSIVDAHGLLKTFVTSVGGSHHFTEEQKFQIREMKNMIKMTFDQLSQEFISTPLNPYQYRIQIVNDLLDVYIEKFIQYLPDSNLLTNLLKGSLDNKYAQLLTHFSNYFLIDLVIVPRPGDEPAPEEGFASKMHNKISKGSLLSIIHEIFNHFENFTMNMQEINPQLHRMILSRKHLHKFDEERLLGQLALATKNFFKVLAFYNPTNNQVFVQKLREVLRYLTYAFYRKDIDAMKEFLSANDFEEMMNTIYQAIEVSFFNPLCLQLVSALNLYRFTYIVNLTKNIADNIVRERESKDDVFDHLVIAELDYDLPDFGSTRHFKFLPFDNDRMYYLQQYHKLHFFPVERSRQRTLFYWHLYFKESMDLSDIGNFLMRTGTPLPREMFPEGDSAEKADFNNEIKQQNEMLENTLKGLKNSLLQAMRGQNHPGIHGPNTLKRNVRFRPRRASARTEISNLENMSHSEMLFGSAEHGHESDSGADSSDLSDLSDGSFASSDSDSDF